ncbi:MAG: hypothetical protein HFJ25_03830 [Clostridia bacterium]|nr:hypothetical protein [Clostridia bacterium]
MINLIINGIFWLITSLANSLLNPLFSAIFALFPSLGQFFTYITNFIQYPLDMIGFGKDFMMIPTQCFVLLFDYYAIKYSIFLIRQATRFTIKVYQTFKP